jgi:hypothetical protein
VNTYIEDEAPIAHEHVTKKVDIFIIHSIHTMHKMAFLFSKKHLKPEQLPTDIVIPLHYFDDNDVFRAIIVDFSLYFDDVLDHEKLRQALVRLMEIGNWKKLGARLRINVLMSQLRCFLIPRMG